MMKILYRNYTFKDNPIRKVSILDETDIPGNVHQLKYHFIKDGIKDMTELLKFFGKPVSSERPYQFAYWGTDKRRRCQNGVESGDQQTFNTKRIASWYGQL